MFGEGEAAIEFRREALPPLAVLEHEWRALEAAGRTSFFTSWHWIGSWLAALPPERRPALLRGTASGTVVALALLGSAELRRRGGLVRSRALFLNETGDPRFDAGFIEHNGLLVAPGCEDRARDALVAWFAAQEREADELHLAGTLWRLPEAAVEGRGLARDETARPSYRLDLALLAAGGGELDAVLSANARQQLRRAMRAFAVLGELRLRVAGDLAQALDFFAQLKALHIASWSRRGRRHAFVEPFFEQFHRGLIERGFAEGTVELLEASAGGEAIGYLYNFRKDGRVYAYQSGFADDDPRLRPGVVTHFMAIRRAFETGAQVYDFLAGHNRLKQSFASHSEPMLWQVVQQPRLAFRLEGLARRLKRAARGRH